MNRYTIFLNLENQYCDKDYNTQNNQQIQCNSYQTTNAFLAELEQIISQFLWKCKDPKSPMQRPQKPNAILRRKNGLEESSFLISDYTTKLQSSRQYVIGTKAKI